jgi:uncharacterized protein (DUF983 family)
MPGHRYQPAHAESRIGCGELVLLAVSTAVVVLALWIQQFSPTYSLMGCGADAGCDDVYNGAAVMIMIIAPLVLLPLFIVLGVALRSRTRSLPSPVWPLFGWVSVQLTYLGGGLLLHALR